MDESGRSVRSEGLIPKDLGLSSGESPGLSFHDVHNDKPIVMAFTVLKHEEITDEALKAEGFRQTVALKSEAVIAHKI